MKWILGKLILEQLHIFQKVPQPYPIVRRLVEAYLRGISLCGWLSLGQLLLRLALRTSWIFHIYPKRMYVLATIQILPIESLQSFYDGMY